MRYLSILMLLTLLLSSAFAFDFKIVDVGTSDNRLGQNATVYCYIKIDESSNINSDYYLGLLPDSVNILVKDPNNSIVNYKGNQLSMSNLPNSVTKYMASIPITFSGDYNVACAHIVNDSNINNNLKYTTFTVQAPQIIDFNVPDIEASTELPNSYDADEELDNIRCKFKNIGGVAAEGSIKLTLKVSGENDDDKETTITLLAPGAEHVLELDNYDVDSDQEDDLDVECKAEFTPANGKPAETNTSNNTASGDIPDDSDGNPDGVNLEITDITVSPRVAARGEEIGVRCDFENTGREDTLSRDDITVSLLIDGDEVESETYDDRLDNGDEDRINFSYIVPYDYSDSRMDVECKIEYEPDDETSLREDHSDKREERITISGDYTGSNNSNRYVDLVANPPFFTAENVIKGRMVNAICRIENLGGITATSNFRVKLMKNGTMFKQGNSNTTDIPSYGSFDERFDFAPDRVGNESYSCEVEYVGDSSQSNNKSSYTYVNVLDKEPVSSGFTTPVYNANTGSISAPQYNLRIASFFVERYENNNAYLVCKYYNSGNANLNGYRVTITKDDAEFSTESISAPLTSGSDREYRTIVNTDGKVSKLGCLITTNDSQRSISEYTYTIESSGFGVSTVILAILLIIFAGIIIIVVKSRI